MRLLFVNNLATHYLAGSFEALARKVDAHFLFYSDGGEWYMGGSLRRETGTFSHEYLAGRNLLPRFRVTPKLVTELARRECDVVLSSINGRFALPVSYLMARLRGKPFVLWTGIWHHPESFFHRLTFPITRWLYHHADAITVYGDHVRRYLMSLGVDGGKIYCAYQAVRNEEFARPVSAEERAALRQKFGLADGPVVLYVGRLRPEKGVQVLIDAFARLSVPAPNLFIVGRGEQEAALRSQAQRLGVKAIFHTEYIPNHDIYRVFSLATALVVPSITAPGGNETWGYVVNEAMNQGVPVVASDTVGAVVSGLVRDGEEGYMVPQADPPALAAALSRILADPELRARLGRAALARVATFTQDRMAQGFVDAAEHALRVKRR